MPGAKVDKGDDDIDSKKRNKSKIHQIGSCIIKISKVLLVLCSDRTTNEIIYIIADVCINITT